MAFKFSCAHCAKSLRASEELAGRKVRCPYCKKSVTIPEAPAKGRDAFEEFQAAAKTAAAGRGEHREKDRSHQRRWVSAGHEWSDSTNINLPVSVLMGLGLAVLFYVVVLPLRDSYIGRLFLERGWVQFVLVFLMGWSVAMLILKWLKISKQRESMLFDLLSTNVAEEINPETLDRFIDNIRELPVKPSESFLISRVLRGLEHFRARRSTPEVANILEMQSEMDANAVESSYTLLKVFIWAIPILGFIGTVMGISAAVGGFSGSLDKAQDIAVLKEALNSVTSGLATAFDTTLVALVMSLLVTFPTSSMQKAEEDVLGRVDDYVSESLIKRLNDGRGEEAPGRPEEIRRAVDDAMAGHLSELETWRRKLHELARVLTDTTVEAWKETNDHLHAQRARDLAEWNEALSALGKRETDVLERMAELGEKLEALHAQRLKDVEALGQAADRQAEATERRLADVVRDVGEAMSTLLSQGRRAQEETAVAQQAAAEETRRHVQGLQEALGGLNDVLGRLGEKQVVILTDRRRWWPFGRPRGGE